MALWSRIINVFRSSHMSREVDEELQSHIDEALESGRDPAEARRAFGSVQRHRDKGREVRVIAWLDSLRPDAVFDGPSGCDRGYRAGTASLRYIEALLTR